MDETNRTSGKANQTLQEEPFDDAVYKRLIDNIGQVRARWFIVPTSILTVCQQKLCIPQRPYCQGTAIVPGTVLQRIFFAMTYCTDFPAELALIGRCEDLVGGDTPVFTEAVQTINLRIEVLDLLPFTIYLSSNFLVEVAGLRRMGNAGKHLALWADWLTRPRRRSEL
jgi:hypothetical protein